jgi:hypothetical protein
VAWELFHNPPNCLSPVRVCAVTRRRFPVGASPTRQPLQPEATGAAPRLRKACDEAVADRIGHRGEYDRYAARCLQQPARHRGTVGENHLWRGCHQFSGEAADAAGIGAGPAIVNTKIATLAPAALREASRNAATRACDSGSLSGVPINAPMRRMRSLNCARAVSGHAATALPISVINSRRRIAPPKLLVSSGHQNRKLGPAKLSRQSNSDRKFSAWGFVAMCH